MLTTEHDIDLTLSSMQKAGVKVLRTWVCGPYINAEGQG
jgi:hypothetical protein